MSRFRGLMSDWVCAPLGRRRFYLAYTALFALMMVLVYGWFYLNGKSSLWTSDSLSQFYSNLLYLREWVRGILDGVLSGQGLAVPLWDMRIGHGEDVLNVVNWRPLNFVSVLFPRDQLELYCWLRFFFCLYLAGFLFCAFVRKLDGAYHATTIPCAFIYTLCGISLFYLVKHPVFVEALVYLPWVLIGAERVLRGQSPWAYVLGLAVCGAAYFYNLATIVIATVVYALVRYLYGGLGYRREARAFARLVGAFVLWTLLGVGLCFVSLLPNLLLALSASRGIANPIELLYGPDYYVDLIGALSGPSQAGIYGYIGMPIIALAVVVIASLEKSPRAQACRFVLAVCAAIFVFPLLARVFNGFAGQTNRWCFVFSFVIAVVCALELPHVAQRSRRTIGAASIVVAAYCAMVLGLSVLGFDVSGNHALLGAVAVAATACLAASGRARALAVLFCLTVVVEISYSGYVAYSGFNGTLISEFTRAGEAYSDATGVTARAVDAGLSERVDGVNPEYTNYYSNSNYGLRSGNAGLSAYYSYSPSSVTKSALAFGVSQMATPMRINSLDQRTVLNELFSVRYVCAEPGQSGEIPYGYSYVATVDGVDIYENDNPLPLVYSYDQAFSEESVSQMRPDVVEQLMLSAAVVGSSDAGADPAAFDLTWRLPSDVLLDTGGLRDILAEGTTREKFRLTDTGVVVFEPFTVDLPCAAEGGSEVQAVFTDILFTPMSSGAYREWQWGSADSRSEKLGILRSSLFRSFAGTGSLEVKSFDDGGSVLSEKRTMLLGETNQYFYGPRDLVINAGYSQQSRSKFTLTFCNTGYYDFSAFELVSYPMGSFDEKVDALGKASEVDIRCNTVTASIEGKEGQWACIAIPRSSGWVATVNGEPADIFSINYEFMGVRLHDGENRIRLEYVTPGLTAGLLISTVSLLALIALLVWSKGFGGTLVRPGLQHAASRGRHSADGTAKGGLRYGR